MTQTYQSTAFEYNLGVGNGATNVMQIDEREQAKLEDSIRDGAGEYLTSAAR